MRKYQLFSFILLMLMVSCNFIQDNSRLFKKLNADDTGIFFSNDITESDSVNVLDYYYCYNGGGVAVGDFNNDSLPDIFFTGNMVSSRLYLNQGELAFKEITELSGVSTQDWIMGVSVVDINADGWLDIYLCVAGPKHQRSYRNLLFVNQGVDEQEVPIFKEMASAYGLADSTFSVHATFFDYDRDGDLDVYLLTNHVDFVDKSYIHPKSYAVTNGLTRDRLYENVGIPDSLDHSYFVDVSEKAGIHYEGYGLGIAVDDLNADGWPDLYVANDFMPNDLIYLNQQDGTFKDVASQSQRHQSYNGMGVDIADINQDMLPDIMVLDMLPHTNERRKTMMAGLNYERFLMEQEAGYIPQFMRNSLQLNRGVDKKEIPQFSDVSQLAGVHDTDWSWSTLFADFDNDSYLDIYVTNGFMKDITDLDFINYKAGATTFGTQQSKQEKKRELTKLLKGVKISNYIFQNQGELAFKDRSKSWGIDVPSYSNGAVYADLDNDGDLDLVVNNINEPAFIFENKSDERENKNHYLQVQLKGKAPNINGIGAKINIYHQQQKQYYYHNPTRGYLSSMLTPVHFGLGETTSVDSLEIYWSNGQYQKIKNITTDQPLMINQKDADSTNQLKQTHASSSVFIQANAKFNVQYKHEENRYNDFSSDPMLPKLYSRGGPAIAVGDIDGQNGDDFFIGGAMGQSATMFIQQADGAFTEKNMNVEDAVFEDMGALLFDADQDGDMDLYVVSGGSEFKAGAKEYQDRLYLNDEGGNFTLDANALPSIEASGSCVVGADYDKDGDIDLFVGGGYQPGAYPSAPHSYLLENEGGKFKDATEEKSKDLARIGMVNTAVWTDFDNDGWTDLIIAGEWMPITFFRNEQGHLINVTSQTGLDHTHGWWNSIFPVDLNQDGNMDYIVGNMGMNVDYKPTPQHPVKLYANDYDDNGKLDPILSHYLLNNENELKLFPFHSRDDIFKQLIVLKKQFRDYESYAHAGLAEVIPSQQLSQSKQWKAETFASCIIDNKGNGKFSIRQLPVEAQFSSVYGILAEDFNQDNQADILITGNSYAGEVMYGWQDASLSLLMTGDGNGNFVPVSSQQSGLFLHSDMKGLASLVNNKGKQVVLATANEDSLVVLEPQIQSVGKTVQLQPLDAYAFLHYQSGKKKKQESYYGAGYLSQSSRVLTIPEQVEAVDIVDVFGNKRTITLKQLKDSK